MASIRGGKSFAHEHMAQVTAAVGTFNFDPTTIRIRQTRYCSFHFFIESGPTTMGIELIHGPIEFCVALTTNVAPFFVKIVVFTCERSFCPLVFDHVPLFGI